MWIKQIVQRTDVGYSEVIPLLFSQQPTFVITLQLVVSQVINSFYLDLFILFLSSSLRGFYNGLFCGLF